jgi:hypothetical protein
MKSKDDWPASFDFALLRSGCFFDNNILCYLLATNF